MSRCLPVRCTALALCVAGGPVACAEPTPDETQINAPIPIGSRVLPRDAELTHAAEQLVAFLRGQGTLDDVQLADTVTLYLAPEGGGARHSYARGRLLDRAQWLIEAHTGRYSFVPAEGLTELTTRVGRHMRCHEQPLERIHPELAALPHVGTMLQPRAAQSCLQSWNVTFVFDAAASPPRLVAAVYDQWEW